MNYYDWKKPLEANRKEVRLQLILFFKYKVMHFVKRLVSVGTGDESNPGIGTNLLVICFIYVNRRAHNG